MNGWKEKMQNKVSSLTEKEIEEFLNTIDVIDEEGSDDVVSTDDEDIDDGINLVDKFSFGCGELGISVSDLNLTLVTPTASVAREESSVNLHGDSTPPAPPKRPKTCAGVSSYIFRRFDGNVVQMRQKDEEISKIVWKKKSMKVHEDQIKFQCPDMSGFVQLTTPYKCFCYFADEHFFSTIVNETNLYVRQKQIDTSFVCTANDIRRYIGILIFMSVYKYPSVRSYWGRHGFEAIRTTMPVNRFEEINRFIHFADNAQRPEKSSEDYDVIYNVRRVIDHFNIKFSSIPMPQRLCVDEQMCATKMTKTSIRQYMPNKPHKWGFKLFVLCDTSGFSYQFELYSGAGDNKMEEEVPDLGASSNVVVRLSKNIPEFANHILYFDNFYTSLGLVLYLESRGIHSLGTIRANRIMNCKLATDSDLKQNKRERGYSEEFVGSAYGIDISTVLWNDNRSVRFASTYVGIQPHGSSTDTCLQKSRRWNRRQKSYEYIDCPQIVQDYNKHMGGVDLMDSLIGRYKIRIKTQKWTTRVFYHLLDMTLVNAYILYNRINSLQHERLTLAEFRCEVAEALTKIGQDSVKGRGRPTNSSKVESFVVGKKKGYMPISDVRFDNVGHWCQFRDRSAKLHCKNKPCNSQTQSYCEKCDIPLCNSSTKNCFKEFHTKK